MGGRLSNEQIILIKMYQKNRQNFDNLSHFIAMSEKNHTLVWTLT